MLSIYFIVKKTQLDFEVRFQKHLLQQKKLSKSNPWFPRVPEKQMVWICLFYCWVSYNHHMQQYQHNLFQFSKCASFYPPPLPPTPNLPLKTPGGHIKNSLLCTVQSARNTKKKGKGKQPKTRITDPRQHFCNKNNNAGQCDKKQKEDSTFNYTAREKETQLYHIRSDRVRRGDSATSQPKSITTELNCKEFKTIIMKN